MKKEMFKRMTGAVKRTALLLCVAMLLPAFAVGCESAQNMIKNRELANEVGKKAEQYMYEKYNRGFKVRKCEAAEGDEYKGDYFISFNSGVHAFYDSEEDMFYDDRQSDVINETILRDFWVPMFGQLGVNFDNINDSTQTFNMVYRYERVGKEVKYSMYHKYFDTTAEHYLNKNKISVTTDNIILVVDSKKQCETLYKVLRDKVDLFFKAQDRGDFNIYAVKTELYSKPDFKAENVNELTDGCVAHFHFSGKQYCSFSNLTKLTDGLYGTLSHLDSTIYNEGYLTLVPVDNSDSAKDSILKKIDSAEKGFLDKYVSKKTEINFEGDIYKVELDPTIKYSEWEDVTLGFVMKDDDGPISEYAEINEKERSFFAYNLNGSEYSATCLCSQNSRSELFTFKPGDEVYFWFGTQS